MYIDYDINRKAYMACHFNCRIETDGLLKVRGSHVGGKSDNVLETVLNRLKLFFTCFYCINFVQ